MKRYLVLLTILTGCGQAPQGNDSSQAVTQSAKSFAVSAVEDLPACGADNLNQLIYVKNGNQFYSCDKEGWTAISLEVKGQTNPSEGNEATPNPTTDNPITVTKEKAGKNCETGGILISEKNSTYYVCNGTQGSKGDKGEQGDKGDKGDDRILAIWHCPESIQFSGGYLARSSIYQQFAGGKSYLQTAWEIVGGVGLRTSVCTAGTNDCIVPYSNSSSAFLESKFENGIVTYSSFGSSITNFSGTVQCTQIF